MVARKLNYSKVSLTHLLACLIFMMPTFSSAQVTINFTQAQADAGKVLYRETCQLCHGSTLSNGQFGTPLKGSFFQRTWQGKTLSELLQYTLEEMPPDDKGKYSPDQNAELIAYILSQNKLEAGETPLASDPTLLNDLMLPW